jgi:hypothetical protein
MAIEDRDLLQANATIIAGVLIFLTIMTTTQFSNASEELSHNDKIANRIIIGLGMFPFILSCWYLLLKSSSEKKGRHFIIAKYITIFGLTYLTIAVSLFLGMLS